MTTEAPESPPSTPGPKAPKPKLTPLEEVEQKLVQQLRTGRAALPVLPRAAAAALKLANDPAASIDELAMLVDTDPPIAARFLSVANSALYFRGMATSSTHAAIVRLGLAYTRDLLFQTVYAASGQGLKRFQKEVQASFHRSVICAFSARIIARELELDLEFAYMCGLLHDIGEARIYRILNDNPKLPKLNKKELASVMERYHAEAGAEVARAWRLPTAIVDACAAHHEPRSRSAPHIRIVMLADVVAAVICAEGLVEPELTTRFERLGVPADLGERFILWTREAVRGL